MMSSEGFNPFTILPRKLMLHVLLQAFGKGGRVSLESLFDYNNVNSDFRTILADEANLKYIVDSMPTEFNIDLINSIPQRKALTDERRYRSSVVLLFLKNLYARVKPFPEDDFIQNRFDDYYTHLQYLEKNYADYPMSMYVCGYVAFYIAKRLLTINPLDNALQNQGAKIYKIAVHCLVLSHELEHPLARIFHGDMELQLQRIDIDMRKLIKEPLPDIPAIGLPELLAVLVPDMTINLKMFADEVQTLLLVTWQKLMLENYHNARELFAYTFRNEKLVNITEYFYNCYQVNHFHRHILAFNPLFRHVEQKENTLYLLQAFTVDGLVHLHQGFQVYHPRPDSVLISTLLEMNRNDLKDFRTIVSDTLSLPQKGSPGWKVCFLDAYRNAVDDGTLKSVSGKQMRMALKYFALVNRARMIERVLERDAEILSCIFHCKNDRVHDVALAVARQLLDFNVLHPLGQLHEQEVVLRLIYQDELNIAAAKINSPNDINRLANIIVDTYTVVVGPELMSQFDMKVYEFMVDNRVKFRELLQIIHERFIESGYLKAA